MKRTANLNIQEVQERQERYTAKHPIQYNFDLQGEQFRQYQGEIKNAVSCGNSEKLGSFVYDIYKYGFMSGQKQLEHDTKAKLDRMDESKRELLKLTYEAPIFHSLGEYLYIILANCIKDCDGMEEMLSVKTRATMNQKLQAAQERIDQCRNEKQEEMTEQEKHLESEV